MEETEPPAAMGRSKSMTTPIRIFLAAALCLVSVAPAAWSQETGSAGAVQEFRPDLFFAGRTRGTGSVTMATSTRPRVLSVEGSGRIAADGEMILDQAVTLDGKTSQRSFRIRRIGEGRWQGTLTDAAGPVRASVAGNRMTLDYRMKRAGLQMHQTLDLQPDGRTVRNVGRVTMLGMQVARVDETIRKLD